MRYSERLLTITPHLHSYPALFSVFVQVIFLNQLSPSLGLTGQGSLDFSAIPVISLSLVPIANPLQILADLLP